jgi:5-formyltetrahydrofolate cyclo-ligase
VDEKKQLRRQLKEELSALSLPLYEHWSFQIAQQLYKDEFWEKAATVAITISRFPEVDTWQIIRKAWEQGKRIVIPKCEAKSRTMDFRELTVFSQLESVYFGLLEPIVSETSSVPAEEIDLVIVPGAAYARSGYRLGFGGGYYDRFLANYHGNTLSLAFEKQLINSLPIERHDIPVRKIISNKEVIKIEC